MGVSDQKMEIPSLDGWRAVAITIVFLSHAGLGHLVPGGLGVTIFFFLSGFLITTLLLREFDRSGTINLRFFYIRRIIRITPPMLIVASVAYLLVASGWLLGGATVQGFVSQVFYFANYYGIYFDGGNTTPVGSGVFWSLAVEEHFYIFFPALFLLFLTRDRFKYFGFFLFSLCLLVLLWRVVLIGYFLCDANRVYYASDTRIDSIVYGCFLAVVCRREVPNFIFKEFFGGFFIIVGLSFVLMSIFVRDDLFRNTIRYSIQGLGLIPLFFYSVFRPNWFFFKPLNFDFIKLIGVYSYTIYLVHHILIENIFAFIHHKFGASVFALFFSLLIAWFINRFVDTPLHPYRVKFR